MMILRTLLLGMLTFVLQPVGASSIKESFAEHGYIEIDNKEHGTETFDALYASFDEFIDFMLANPFWAHQLQVAKERFVRSKHKHFYSTDIFGFYDESDRISRSQISFYYSSHFHEFVCSHHPDIEQIPEIAKFFQLCREINQPYEHLFRNAATELEVEAIFSSDGGQVPILFKVIKYLPDYKPQKPHFDGTVFSLLLDSTDNDALLLSPYKSTFSIKDFSSPVREFSRQPNQSSALLIPGVLLKDFSIYPTPHIVLQSGNIRYAAVVFGMRPYDIFKGEEFPSLPQF